MQPPVYGAAEEQSSQPALSMCSVWGRVRVADCVWSQAAVLLEEAGRCYPIFLFTQWGSLRTSPDRPQPKPMNEQLTGQPLLRLQYVCWLSSHCTCLLVVVQHWLYCTSFACSSEDNNSWNCCDSLFGVQLSVCNSLFRLDNFLCWLILALVIVPVSRAGIVCDG